MTSPSERFHSGLTHFAQTLERIALDDTDLNGALRLLSQTPHPVICSGVGKSGFIAAKMVATLNSLAIRAAYLNPTDALHGDLGFVADGSVVILISNSGTTAELKSLIPSLQARGCQIISVVSNPQSALGQAATHCLAYGALQEADEHRLAPTTSTVVQLALADLLAATASQMRGFSPVDFYRNHPAGALGKRLMKVDALMRTGDRLPVVSPDTPLLDVLASITAKYIGCTCVIDADGRLRGLITDGDIRRALEQRIDLHTGVAADVMSPDPQTALLGEMVEKLMQKSDFLGRHFTIPVIDEAQILRGVLVSIDLI